jgi:hypothetical protein
VATPPVIWGPYYIDFLRWVGPQGLPTGAAKTFTVDVDGTFKGTLTVTAHPDTIQPGAGQAHDRTALFVADSYIQNVPLFMGDIVLKNYVIWFTLANVGLPPIAQANVWITTIRPD